MSNIKSRVQIFLSKNSRAYFSIQEYERLKPFMTPAKLEYTIGSILTTEDSGEYKIVDIKFRCLDEEVREHMSVGIDTSLLGESHPYNSEILIYLEKV